MAGVPIARSLTRDHETIELVPDDDSHAAITRFLELGKKRLAQGWTPTTPAKAATKMIAALESAGVHPTTWITALTDDELDVAYGMLMKRGARALTLDVLRKRPTRAAFAWALQHYGDYYAPDWPKAVKFLAKTHDWVPEELATTKKLPAKARAFADRWIKQLGKAAPAPPNSRATADDEAGLLAAIAAAPADDGPRMIYADWLLDRGDKMGEYIQAALKPDNSISRPAEKRLTAAWSAEIRPFMRTWSFDRGLISWLTTEGKLYVQAADAIALRAPRAQLTLTGIKARDWPAIVRSPLGAFQAVRFTSQRLDTAQVMELVASPTLAGVEILDLGSNRFDDAAVLAIARSPHVSRVRELDLSDVRAFAPTTLAAVLALKQLESIRLDASSLGGAFTGAVARLRDLHLRAPVDEVVLRELAGVKAFGGLRSLSITGASSNVGAGAYRMIAKAFPSLTHVQLGVTDAPDDVLALLAKRAV